MIVSVILYYKWSMYQKRFEKGIIKDVNDSKNILNMK